MQTPCAPFLGAGHEQPQTCIDRTVGNIKDYYLALDDINVISIVAHPAVFPASTRVAACQLDYKMDELHSPRAAYEFYSQHPDQLPKGISLKSDTTV